MESITNRNAMSFDGMYNFEVLRELRKQNRLTLKEVAESSGVSIGVISKLERNQTVAELETIYKLGRVFGMNPSDLLALSERRASQTTEALERRSGDFTFKEIRYGNIRAIMGKGRAGAKVSTPKIHRDDYEVCWVLSGRMIFQLPNETKELGPGDAIQFDALLEHSYEAVENSEFLIIHLRKGKRF
jgi:transcriptional regulator with XRE-family HTH domain